MSGEIVHLGPTYTSLLGSFRAQQEWLNCWGKYYQKPGDLETLRRVNEQYTAKILDYEDKDLARIREIQNPDTVAWRITGLRRLEKPSPEPDETRNELKDNEEGQPKELRICLGTDHLITVVPAAVKAGDVVVRFWNCDAAILMRPINPQERGTSNSDGVNHWFMLVGRADVAELVDRKATPGCDVHAEEAFKVGYPWLEKASRGSGAVYVNLDLRTLQLITACIST